MEVARDLYLNKLIDRKQNGLVKVITGIRRCGKSYLLNTLFYNHLIESGVEEDHIIRFAFDSADELSSIGENPVLLEREKRGVDPNKFMDFIGRKTGSGGTYYLLLDEVQLLDCFEAVLNGYLRKPDFDIYVTGSNAKFLSKDIITEFAGRGDEIRIAPLSFAEFMSVYKGDRYAGLTEYMLYGGIPLVVLREKAEDKIQLLKNLFDEIYIRDIVKRNNLRSPEELEKILNFLSSSVGSLTNPEKLKNTFRSARNSSITSKTVKKYLDCLEDSFLIDAAYRYDVKGKAYIDTPLKYYFSDLGLRNARINFRQFDRSHCMENLIYNELKIRGFNVDVGVVPVEEKEEDGRRVRKNLEIDFICNQGSSRYYIQSAYSIPDADKEAQEKRPFKKVNDAFRRILITNDMIPMHFDDDGILEINIYDFLLEPEKAFI